MTTYDSRLTGREAISAQTMAFRFEKPAGFGFKPGQAIDVVLVDPPSADAASARHTFSIVTAPHESELVVATRMRDSAFKRALGELAIGSSVRIEGPSGSLTLHGDRTRAAVFVAGGIGVTPFMSILRHAANHGLDRDMVLLYANRRPEDAAFLAELQQLDRESSRFRLVATMTRMDGAERTWDGQSGRIDEALIRRAVGDLAAPVYYVAGPPAMVEAATQMLNRFGVGDDDIRSEVFYGY